MSKAAQWEQVCDDLAMLASTSRTPMYRATTQPARDFIRERIERESVKAKAMHDEMMKAPSHETS